VEQQTQQLILLGQKIRDTQAQISQVNTETIALEGRMREAQQALDERAVQMYRSNRTGMLEVLLSAKSPSDLVARAQYLLIVTERDAMLITDVRQLHSQNLYLENSLSDRLNQLVRLQAEADTQRQLMETAIAAQEAKARALGTDIAQMLRDKAAQDAAQAAISNGASPTTGFNPDNVISEPNFRASTSLNAAQIQAFLDQQPGSLRSLRGPDHNGIVRSAAEMIAEAAVAWDVNPKVILVTLQKEQSLLSKARPSQEAYDWAMGCGKADSRTYYEYQGFGKQIWWGASKFQKNAALWKPGATMTIDGSAVHPANPGTHAQYRYTPHFHGVRSFWALYWRYFGNPLG
jgi:hypothetical protein